MSDSYLETNGNRADDDGMPPLPDLEICAYCRDHASFELIDGVWLSACCGSKGIDVDVEFDDFNLAEAEED